MTYNLLGGFLTFATCRKTLRFGSNTLLLCTVEKLCSHVFTSFLTHSSLIRPTILQSSIRVYPGLSSFNLFACSCSHTPVPPQNSLAELSFILQYSKQLHQTLPFSSISARHSSNIKFLFSPPLPPINIFHSLCLTSKASLPTQVPPTAVH